MPRPPAGSVRAGATSSATSPAPVRASRRGARSRAGWSLVALACAACASAPVTPGRAPGPTSDRGEEGLASWYGEPYHGRPTASGERYDMHQMTAAHRTLPFGTRIRVTNVATSVSAEVTVNDRGPFVAGRILDLSRAAAERLGAVGPGVIRVRIEIVAVGDGMPDEPCWNVQVGAFGMAANAGRARANLEAKGYRVVFAPAGGGLTRVRVADLPGRERARETAVLLASEYPGATPVPCGGGW